MKQALSLILLLMAVVFSSKAIAQDLTKAEKKALKKEVKQMMKTPEMYRDFKSGIQEKKDHLVELEGQIDDLNESINTHQEQVGDKDKKIKELGDEIARLKTAKEEINRAEKDQTNIEGLVYKVQVEIDDASLYQEVSEIDGTKRPVFTGDQDDDGTKKYTLGYFKNKEEADTFRKYLSILRIKEAKTVVYKDGKKVE